MRNPDHVNAVVAEWVLKAENDSPAPSLAEARKAVAIARRVRRDVRRLLPRAALRRTKK
jgi:hypothetical protein